jgi:hypothetical protein
VNRRRRRFFTALLPVVFLTLAAASCDSNDSKPASMGPAASPSGYMAQRIVTGLSVPVGVYAPPGDTSRVFIVEKTGTIRIYKSGALLPNPFFTQAGLSSGNEQGLLGLAFHPQYATNGKFYVYYTDVPGDIHVVEYLVSSDPDSASATSREILFVSHQPNDNHNGGQIAFGSDGFLYIGIGDGGGAGDVPGNGQNLNVLLGKILRLDVDAGSPYAVPASNPFANQAGRKGEIWSYGLRNPWRFSFDRANGDMYIGDVGQDNWEEVDYEPNATGGRNYGWHRMEGNHCFMPPAPCDQTGITLPVTEYDHSVGCSITGGYVYRGSQLPELQGTYFYGDYCTGIIRSFKILGGTAAEPLEWTSSLRTEGGGAMTGLSSFGQDAAGELYMVLLGGDVYRLAKRP